MFWVKISDKQRKWLYGANTRSERACKMREGMEGRKPIGLFCAAVVCVTFLWLLTMYWFPLDMDYMDFIRYWVQYVDEDLFGVYAHFSDEAHFVNYPPLYLLYLYLIRQPVLAAQAAGDWHWASFLLKDICLVCHVLFTLVLIQKQYVRFAVAWFFSPVLFLISATTIHIDLIFCMVLVGFLFAVIRQQSWLVYLLFAVACLMKLQGAYLFPVILVYFWYHRKVWRQEVLFVLPGFALGVAVWLPFVIASRSWSLPFQVYFGSFETNYTNMQQASSVHGLFGWMAKMFAPDMYQVLITKIYPAVGVWLLAACVVWFLILQVRRVPFVLSVFSYFYLVFYITCSQDHRYFVYSIVIATFLVFVCGQESYRRSFVKMNLVFVVPSLINAAGFVVEHWSRVGQMLFLFVSISAFVAVYILGFLTHLDVQKQVWKTGKSGLDRNRLL